RTFEGVVVPSGTRYRVERGPDGTDVEVFEGSVHLTGDAIFRIAGPGQPDVGKQAPAKELDLRAGERARLINVRATTGAMPLPVPTAVLPPWALPPAKSADSGSPLAKPDPWNDARVQGMIDEWLRTAMPPSNNPQVIMHYNEWAQPLSQSATATS